VRGKARVLVEIFSGCCKEKIAATQKKYLHGLDSAKNGGPQDGPHRPGFKYFCAFRNNSIRRRPPPIRLMKNPLRRKLYII